ncbi:MAG: hypothetical protein ACR2F9_09160 [Longimicrobiaceae bacterium]|jgi:hypothetical protein
MYIYDEIPASVLPATLGKVCPRCGRWTTRRRDSLLMRALARMSRLAGDRWSFRRCYGCSWEGMALHR